MHTWWPLKGKPQELFLGPGPPSLCLHTVAVLAAAERDPPGSTWRTARFVQGSHLSFGGTSQNCFHLSALPPVKPPTDTQAKPRAPMPHSPSTPPLCTLTCHPVHSPEHCWAPLTTCAGSAGRREFIQFTPNTGLRETQLR